MHHLKVPAQNKHKFVLVGHVGVDTERGDWNFGMRDPHWPFALFGVFEKGRPLAPHQ